jgi:predicted O-methyltransferase YrrM
MIFFRIVKYLKYILLSHHRKGHGIHSPFVFDLVSRIFRNKIDKEIIQSVEHLRKKMISDRRRILVQDMGSKSELLKNAYRNVSDIARRSPVPEKYGVLLANMAAVFGNPLIIEFGTSLGISTIYLAEACKDVKVITIEGCPSIAEIAKQNFIDAGLTNISLLTGSFDAFIPDLALQGVKPGLIFIDGNHRKKPVLDYFNKMAGLADNNTVIVIDDIYYSSQMSEAWAEIKLHKKVSVTIDIFRMGICFFREGINHNDYVIRY